MYELQKSSPNRPIGSSERHVWWTVPNILTLLRMLAMIPFTFLAMRDRDIDALLVFFAAGLTDTLDGTLARRFGQQSKVGRLLDPVADKLYTGVSFVVLSVFRDGLFSIPRWLMSAVLLRDVFILSGSFFVYRVSRNSGFKSSFSGKLNTFLEISVIVCFLAASRIPWLMKILPALYVVVFLSILLSAADYLRIGVLMMKDPATRDA